LLLLLLSLLLLLKKREFAQFVLLQLLHELVAFLLPSNGLECLADFDECSSMGAHQIGVLVLLLVGGSCSCTRKFVGMPRQCRPSVCGPHIRVAHRSGYWQPQRCECVRRRQHLFKSERRSNKGC
jgi:hypothetical protein